MMRRTFRLAVRGRGNVSPNPRVGAIILSPNGRIIGEGYHTHFGGPHAEVAAIEAIRRKNIRNATLIVNLEPCCSHGKTPPCVDAIIRSGMIGTVVIATTDPDPNVDGKGIVALREAGLKVDVGLLSDQARYLNRGFFSYKLQQRAWCAAKVAVSLDGKMADPNGYSKSITGPQSRKKVHLLRADHDGILVGGRTVINDDPQLTVRSATRGPDPIRVILAPHTGIPPNSQIANSLKTVRTILIALESLDPPGCDLDGIEVIRLPDSGDGRIDPELLLQKLPEYGVTSLLIEGGSEVLSSFMQAGVIDEITVCIAPSVIGNGISPFEGFLPKSWDERPQYIAGRARKYGSDTAITFRKPDDPEQ
ncbi:MAG: bifunctional diaminohydroxyphosphoribosylaminopyrimidine deaminase/5-amino-6-(5-phosphoribosylamino)uracil reductase RibD [Candidatus Electryoneaceae bacterium]|nr:bifunctional diaminohydroxyphosphoribosylaminopyrimidine deaminase/5-amino-6-(5-phosphoribosylamino)uracil reductase RibD [Candidatus Electryoneaceae bacterium]